MATPQKQPPKNPNPTNPKREPDLNQPGKKDPDPVNPAKKDPSRDTSGGGGMLNEGEDTGGRR